jgi:hypothetical protein
LEIQQLVSTASELKDHPAYQAILDRLIEHDRWKTEATFAHQLRLEEMRHSYSGTRKYASVRSDSGFSEEDRKFNSLSSYGACTDKQLGLISKTKVWEGANERASKLFESWYSHIQDNNLVPLKDLKEGRIKALLLAFLWASGCAHRVTKWPDAGDAHFVDSMKKELVDRFSKFSKHSIVAAYESLKVFWKEINDYEQCSFNSSLIADILDNAYQYVSEKTTEESNYDVKNSPLFSDFEKVFPYVPLETLERYYVKNRKNFVAAGVGALRKVFTGRLPEELEHRYSTAEWPKKWHLHIASFEEKWQQQLYNIVNSTREEQEKWKKE